MATVADTLQAKIAPGLVSVEEYLHTDYSPDCDYVDGHVQERNLGEYDHSTIQDALLAFFRAHAQEWQIKARPELRLQVLPTRYRVPDVMVLRRDTPKERIITHPPLVCIEVLSPEDRFGRMEEKIDEYLAMGVPAVWVIDPEVQQGYRCEGGHFHLWRQTDDFAVPATPITMQLSALLKDLD